MINRVEFERFLVNHYGCKPWHGRDATLCREVNGVEHTASFGGHQHKKVHREEACRFLLDLAFDRSECDEIMQNF